MTNPTQLRQGQIYHIYARGENREKVFFDERIYPFFLQLCARHIEPVADTYAYCLLPDHFHFLVRIRTEEEIRKASEALGVSWVLEPNHQFGNLLNAYADVVNQALKRTGSLFQEPFGRVQVTSDVYLVHLVAYIHQNPEKHGLVESFRDWPHSSYEALLSEEPTHLKRPEVLAWFDGPAAFGQFHRQPAIEALIADLAPDDFD
jgi:REP element-mobilizing transposase RayT